MLRWSISLLVILWSVGLPMPAGALEEQALPSADVADWGAIGRISFNSPKQRFSCTGTLVAPDKVLTAAHCLARQFGQGPSQVRQVVFAAGWHVDHAIATRTARSIVFHPSYRPNTPLSETVPHDMALITLDSPIADVAPVQVGDLSDAFQLVSYLVYTGNGSQPPRLVTGCSHTYHTDGILEMGCKVEGGNSGGGVLAGSGTDRRLVAVISASSGARAIAAFADDWLRGQLNGD